MKKAHLSAAVLGSALLVLLPVSAAAQARTRVVDDDGRASGVSCDAANPAPRLIQAAIDLSASGDTILVCPGVYPEQLKVVSKDLTIRGVTSGDLNQVLIRPRGMLANSTNAFSGAPVAAVIAVESSVVILRSLTIDGADNLLTACAPTLIGVFYRDASGEVQSTAVRDIRLGPTLEGCQSGFGIFAQSGAGSIARLTVTDSSVHGYQKVGILANEGGTDLQALSNTVTGDGVTSAIAQNGIQLGYGASGRITGNTILSHVYTCPTFPCDASTSILVFESSQVTVAGNETGKAVVGIYLFDSNDSEVRNNRVSDSELLDGIVVIGNRNHVHLNRVVNSDEFAVSVDGERNVIEKNVINDAPCGIFASGTHNKVLDNSMFSTELATCQPFTLSLQTLSFAARARSASSFSLASREPAAGAALATDSSGVALRAPTPVR